MYDLNVMSFLDVGISSIRRDLNFTFPRIFTGETNCKANSSTLIEHASNFKIVTVALEIPNPVQIVLEDIRDEISQSENVCFRLS